MKFISLSFLEFFIWYGQHILNRFQRVSEDFWKYRPFRSHTNNVWFVQQIRGNMTPSISSLFWKIRYSYLGCSVGIFLSVSVFSKTLPCQYNKNGSSLQYFPYRNGKQRTWRAPTFVYIRRKKCSSDQTTGWPSRTSWEGWYFSRLRVASNFDDTGEIHARKPNWPPTRGDAENYDF